jgi:hypothetical protein
MSAAFCKSGDNPKFAVKPRYNEHEKFYGREVNILIYRETVKQNQPYSLTNYPCSFLHMLRCGEVNVRVCYLEVRNI